MLVTDLISQLPNLDGREINQLLEAIKEEINNRSISNSNSIYLKARNEFFTHRENRRKFLTTQIDMGMPPWQALKEPKKKEFQKAWDCAIQSMVDLGFEQNKYLNDFVIELLGYSKTILEADGFHFKDVLYSLKNIVDVMQQQFPGYVGSPALEILISHVGQR